MLHEFPEALKQTLITRLAALNSAVTFLGLMHSATPATIDDWLTLAELVEQWVWRGLTSAPCPQSPDVLPPPAAPLAPPAPVVPSTPLPPPAASARNGDGARPSAAPALPPAATETPSTPPAPPPPAGQSTSQRKDAATVNQIRAIFGISKAKGYSTTEVKTWVKGQYQKAIDDLTFREASKLIERLKAL
jgi:hypothetical protein